MAEHITDALKRLFAAPIVCAVSGGRDYTDDRRLTSVLDMIHNTVGIEVLVEGGCPVGDGGADERARKWAKNNEVNCMSIPPKSKKHGWPACGPLRNQEIGKCNVELWVLFPGGKGTNSARNVATENGIAIFEVSYGSEDRLIEGWRVTSGEADELTAAPRGEERG